MKLATEFNLVATEYDNNRRKFIPCFDEFYDCTTEFIASKKKCINSIMDLGAGTGLLSLYWSRYFPSAHYYLIDVAEDMLKVARSRFAGFKNFEYITMNYKKELPNIKVDCIISALSIHHLINKDKQKLFDRIYAMLNKDDFFVNYDQFCAGERTLNQWYDSYWINKLEQSNLSKDDLDKWKIRKKFDHECTFDQEVQMLKASGFKTVINVYTNQKFSVIVAIK